jgi:hypothetical protein
MLSFTQFLLEYPISYFKAMPDAAPPEKIVAAQRRFGLDGVIKWKVLTNRSIHQSEELDDDVIVMKPGDRLENWFHELGHKVYDNSDKEKINPLLTRIRDKYRVHNRDYDKQYWSRVKQIELGGNWYSYSHSGKDFEFDELFAVTFAYVVGDGGKFPDKDIQQDYEAMLEKLTDSKTAVK